MRLVLTHEQADLDALASLMAAHLLDPQSYALLPRLINRNGAAYIQRYGTDLGLCTIKEIPNEAIEEVTLVDTQSLVTLRGFSNKTSVRVIDHHPRRTQTDPQWATDIQFTGACTTLLVEKIKQAQLPLSVSQATFLLLGIYEDTGSLTYASTTPRDIYASAFLLEHGADLNVASHYLNPPLSNSQQLLFDRLLKDMTTHVVEDRSIIIAKASALDLSDEISSVAHKLREFLNPDGLVILVSTRQGIRLVGRSTTNDVDMGKLAQYFGGGGHKRASSALIRTGVKPSQGDVPSQWRSIYLQVAALLPEIVSPTLRVRQIMSQKPLLLESDTPAEAAAELMRRYGFEGYPVIEKGELVGLLTRRNVDRALSHKLQTTAGSLMDAGKTSVAPDDTIEHLQEVMAASGWGQVPVVDPVSGEIIGIVTRTDLIAALSQVSQVPKQQEMAEMLQNALHPDSNVLLQVIAREAGAEGVQAYIVGGFVRDLLLGYPSQDFDIVVEGDAIQFVSHLVNRFGGRLVTHSRFGTAKWILSDDKSAVAARFENVPAFNPEGLPDHLDLISARTEFYEKPAALPTVERSSIKMDLHRRDFTINTLALRLDAPYYGLLLDFWGGYDDLKRGQIRVLHALSFVDDATRMLRAVRFAVRFDFGIEQRTLTQLEAGLPLLDEVTGSRLRHELDLILVERKAADMLAYLEELGILKAIHPELPWDERIASRLERYYSQVDAARNGLANGTLEKHRSLGWSLWLQDLEPKALQRVARRLRLSGDLVRRMLAASQVLAQLPGLVTAKPSQVVEALRNVQPEVLAGLLSVVEPEPLRQVLRDYTQRYNQIKPLTDGDALRARGLQPSPQFRVILSRLRDAWLDGEIQTAEEEKALLEQLISQA